MNLNSRNVVITGASSGIGLAVLKLLLARKCKVVACARHIEKIGISNDNLFLKKCDVSNIKELDELFEYALDKLGDIDVFISNAGFAYYEQIAEANEEHINNIFATNVTSAIYAAEKMHDLKGNKGYNFVVTASAMAELSLPGYALYSSTKAAIKGFGDGYRYELNKDQHFEVVYPIATKTEFFNRAGNSTPIPWPTQKAETVAKKIIKGIEKDRNHIYPSLTFRIISIVNRVFPFILKIYAEVNNVVFKRWLKSKGE